jgi:hypothetical protein
MKFWSSRALFAKYWEWGTFLDLFFKFQGPNCEILGYGLISKKSRAFSSKFPRINRITNYFHKINSCRLGPRFHGQGPVWFIVEHDHREAVRSPESECTAVGARRRSPWPAGEQKRKVGNPFQAWLEDGRWWGGRAAESGGGALRSAMGACFTERGEGREAVVSGVKWGAAGDAFYRCWGGGEAAGQRWRWGAMKLVVTTIEWGDWWGKGRR